MKYALMLLTTCCLALAGCATAKDLFGLNPKAPTAAEQMTYNIQTNYVTQVQQVTNVVTQYVPVYVTNQLNQVVLTTNVLTQLNVTSVTNQVPQYTLTPNSTSQATAQGIGAVVNTFAPGVGSAVTMGLLALLGAWGHLRSAKNSTTAGTLAQEVETLREFIQALPNGTAYDTAITGWLQQHQLEAGVAQQVLGLLNNTVDNPAAKAAVTEISSTLTAFGSNAPKVNPTQG